MENRATKPCSRFCTVRVLAVSFALILWVFPRPATAGDSDSIPGAPDHTAGAENATVVSGSLPAFLETLRQAGDGQVRLVLSGATGSPSGSPRNPGNSVFQLPDTRFLTEVRPDVSVTLDRLFFSLKPRLHLESEHRDNGIGTGGDSLHSDLFINEWLVRLAPTERFHLSFGRENLQWGPAFLASPSNPFFTDNGRLNPREEVPGKELARAVWSVSDALSLSLVNSTGDPGHDGTDSVDGTLALKLDWNGGDAYGSLILSQEAGDRPRLGVYGGRLVSDALLVYIETAVRQGSKAGYPASDQTAGPPVLVRSRFHDTALETTCVAGGAYTFLDGTTLTAEYLFQSAGYTDREATVWLGAETGLNGPGIPGAAPADPCLSVTEPGLGFLRRNYLMLQAVKTGIQDILDLTGRWTWNLDDHSGRMYASLSSFIGDHLEVFVDATVNTGGADTEFRQYYSHRLTLGLELVF